MRNDRPPGDAPVRAEERDFLRGSSDALYCDVGGVWRLLSRRIERRELEFLIPQRLLDLPATFIEFG